MTAEPAVRLRPTQRATLTLLAAGLTPKQIARRLGCTPQAAYYRINTLKKALGVASRFDVLVVADRLGLVSDADVDAVRNPPAPPASGSPLTWKPRALPADARRIARRLTASPGAAEPGTT